MEYLILAAALLVLFLIYACNCIITDRKRRKAFEKSLHTDYGKASEKKYPDGRLATIAGHFRKKDALYAIDDITWNDLDMDRVFQAMDHTFSAAGEEALYTILRCPCLSEEELLRRDDLIGYFMEHEQQRVALQLFYARMGRTGKYSIYDYLDYLDTLGKRSNVRHYAVLGLMILAVALCFVKPSLGIAALCALICINMVTYFKEKGEIDPYITTFGYFLRVLRVVKELEGYKLDKIKDMTQELCKRGAHFKRFSRFSFLLMHQSDMASGNPLDLIVEYLRMGLHLNLIKFNTMLEQVRMYKEDIIYMIEQLGYLEAMLAIGWYRASLPYFTKPEFSASLHKCHSRAIDDEEKCDDAFPVFTAENMYHPLIDEPVANSISVTRDVLLTGSNASGKSTFLKTVAISQILAQSVATVPAERFVTSFYRIYTSMALRDDLKAKESYFIVEIKAMKRILDAVSCQDEGVRAPVMCFVDEVLRGTNTVERIASSTQILRSLAEGDTLSFAATHDIELTELLQDVYENYHFTEEIAESDVQFSYRLQQGKATSRNAIRLLGVMGYDESIIERAEEMARTFMREGVWKS